ncbi:MAG: hypothetical protein IPJ81_01795 [Chitinophagaceae bacterium]|nr:hypothetical protein [Chitinophagaceae bacterium]
MALDFALQLKKNIDQLNKLRDDIRKTSRIKHKSKEDQEKLAMTCKIFYDNFYDLAFPGGYQAICDLKKSEPQAIDNAIAYLKANPYFFRSGYIKEHILTTLKKLDLTALQQLKLQNVIINVIDLYYCREFRYYCRLAKKIPSEFFIEKLQRKSKSGDLNIAKRASWVLDSILK